MAATPSLTLVVFLISSLSLLSLFIKRRRRIQPRLEPEKPLHQSTKPPLHSEPIADPPPPSAFEVAAPSPSPSADGGEEDKRRKKRGRKKRPDPAGGSDGREEDRDQDSLVASRIPYPFSTFASATQRKIKMQYDQIVQSNQAKALTITQVGQFVNCLVEARNELQHKSDIIKRSFKIKKALLFKADRSSYDRHCQQIYKLEAEHKRLEEDAAVYNLLQQQLKLSPAYKTMLEMSVSAETNVTSVEAMEVPDISFEELLAQEKKDSFWQTYRKQKSYTR